jgi:hypothetical protein
MPYLDPNQDLKAYGYGSKSSQSSSNSVSYNYDGQDIAAKAGDELSKLSAAKSQALIEDPLSTVGTNNRIRNLQRYLTAYNTGTSLPDMPVLPGVRVSSASSSSDNDSNRTADAAFFDPHARGQNRTS